MPTARSTKTTLPRVVRRLEQWLVVRDEAAQYSERADTLKDRIKEELPTSAQTYTDEKGSIWYDLPGSGITFKDRKGKVYKYIAMKLQRSLTPASPLPIPEKAIAVLKKHKLWLTPEQEKVIKDLQIACPFAVVSVDLDATSFASAVFKNLITDREYQGTLQPQKESFSFITVEG
jgi:hypothetical protein